MQLPAKLEPIHIAGELSLGDHQLDFRMLIEKPRSIRGVKGMEGQETRFAENVGCDHSDEWLVLNDQCGRLCHVS
jgi:hypothetical protein